MPAAEVGFLRIIVRTAVFLVSLCAVDNFDLSASAFRLHQHSHAAVPLTTVDKAKILVQKGNPQGALMLLQHPTPKESESADFHALKGLCQAMLGKPMESSAEFEQALALRPDYAPFHLSYGLALANFNNLEGASEQLASALKLDPSLPGVRFNYALVLARLGEFSESGRQVDSEFLSKYRGSESTLELWLLKAHDLYAEKKWQGTIDGYRKVLQLRPGYAEAYAAIGEALYSLNRPRESMAALRKAIFLNAQDAGSRVILGKLYQEAGEQDEAIATFEAADHLQPGDRDVIYRLFRIYHSKGDVANAARLQKKLQGLVENNLAQSTNEAEAARLNNAGIALESRGLLAQALDSYEQAAKADVTNIVFPRNAALLLCKMGRTEEAIPRLREILLLEPDDAETSQILKVAEEIVSGSAPSEKQFPSTKVSRF